MSPGKTRGSISLCCALLANVTSMRLRLALAFSSPFSSSSVAPHSVLSAFVAHRQLQTPTTSLTGRHFPGRCAASPYCYSRDYQRWYSFPIRAAQQHQKQRRGWVRLQQRCGWCCSSTSTLSMSYVGSSAARSMSVLSSAIDANASQSPRVLAVEAADHEGLENKSLGKNNRNSASVTSSGSGPMTVTLLSGFVGAGKTTLMKNIMRQAREERLSLAVIANDMADVNIDAQLLPANDRPGDEEDNARSIASGASVAMQDGYIYCTLQDDLRREVEALAKAGKYQHLVIESTGISDPTPVAEALIADQMSSEVEDDVRADSDERDASGEQHGGSMSPEGVARFSLDTLVTVVDSTSFLDEVRKADDLDERGLDAPEGDTRTIADLLVSQVEFANLILLNKADLVSEHEMETLEAVVRELNPAARIIKTVDSSIGLADVVATGSFDLEEASVAAGWVQALNDAPSAKPDDHDLDDQRTCGHDPEHQRCHNDDYHDDNCHDEKGGAKEKVAFPAIAFGEGARRRKETFGVSTFTFQSDKPFHPERLMAFVMESLPSVLRSKGFLWLASRHETAGVWSHAGGSFATEYGGPWDGNTSEENYGDSSTSGNELVFMGVDMDEERLKTGLRGCLLTDGEMAGGPRAWKGMSDPFPPWE